MTTYLAEIGFEIVDPGCGCAAFAVPEHIKAEWLKSGKTWYCPFCGDRRHYITGETKEQRRAREAEEEAERLRNALQQETEQKNAARRMYSRIRQRVQRGQCPCCDQKFNNLREHMEAAHQLDSPGMLRTLRETFGMTQADLARETGVNASIISNYENGRSVSEHSRAWLEQWAAHQVEGA